MIAGQALTVGSGPLTPRPAAANHERIKFPFAAGADWYVSQGYNTSPAEGWSHFNCDPKRLKDEISRSTGCDAGWQYKYSLDLQRSDGSTTGQSVLSPVDGTIRWIDEAYGGMSIDLGDGYAVAFFHADLARGLEAGQPVRQGERLGAVAGPGGGGNGGTPHIHLTVWQTDDGGNWSRQAIPFTDQQMIDGFDLPALSEQERNQHWNAVVVSSNTELASPDRRAAPVAPLPASPAPDSVFAPPDNRPTLTWAGVADAAEYQVVINDGERLSPWVAGTSWSPGRLPPGSYAWQVRARNETGESGLGDLWSFSITDRGSASSESQLPTDTGGESEDRRDRSPDDERSRDDKRGSDDPTGQETASDDSGRHETATPPEEDPALVPAAEFVASVDGVGDDSAIEAPDRNGAGRDRRRERPRDDRDRHQEYVDAAQTAPGASTDGSSVSTTATGESGTEERAGGERRRDKRDNRDAADDPAAPPAEEPAPPVEEAAPAEPVADPPPAEEAAPAPVPVTQELVFVPVADGSVTATAPDEVKHRREDLARLAIGGPDVAISYLTFQVVGAAPGTVISARLIVTGVGDNGGAGGAVSALPEVWIDEANLSFATAPGYGGSSALTASGEPATYEWLEPGVETAVDVSGTVTGDGVVTFVLLGTPDVTTAVGSRESHSPPRLVVTTSE